MLVKYKNLNNGKITEEKDLFISQLQEKLPDISEDFINSVVDCFQHTIFKEVKIGIVRRGGDTDPEVEADTRNFFNEIKKFSQAPNHYVPKINLNLAGFDGKSLKFLLRATPEDLAEFAESYDTTIPDVSRDRICEVTGFVFDAMRDATERGLDGERCQTQKERIAEETWNKEYAESPSVVVSNPEESKLDNSKSKKSVSIKV